MIENQNSVNHRKHVLGFVINSSGYWPVGILRRWLGPLTRRLNGIAWDYFKSQSTASAPDSEVASLK